MRRRGEVEQPTESCIPAATALRSLSRGVLLRLGSVFGGRRQKVELNKEDPTYTVRYLGNAVTLHAKGEGCTEEAVGKIWAKSEAGAGGAKMKLTLGPHGIRMAPGEKGARRPGHAYLLHRITYCAADRRHPKVFAWVYRHQVKNKAVVLRCHAVLVPKAATARAMALLLFQTSASAFNEFKRLKRQNDGRHVQQQLLGEAIVPLVPLRRLLNAKCPYRPPAERAPMATQGFKYGALHSPEALNMMFCTQNYHFFTQLLLPPPWQEQQ
uniref:Family with sequence similarity 43 member B n=1 Tax=Anas platyrhynchos TaxID=8839 RepID=A0A8B9SRK3_ANAPL